MSRFKLLLILLCLTLGSANAATRDPGSYFFDQFLGNFKDELQMARDEGKQGILIMFEMDECPFCHRMKTRVLNQVEVQDYFKEHFLIYAVDVEGDVEITDFQGQAMKEKDFAFKQFKVRATPVFGFFDLDGKLITKFTGATNDAREFLWLGEFVVDEYKRAKKSAASNP
ncbi:MAG: thioredoxin family protein [Candidatus Thiodiazotropha sp.]